MPSKTPKNDNRIVRVRNDYIHKDLLWIAKTTKTPYQHVFDAFMEYIIEGNVYGAYSAYKIVEKLSPRE